MKHFAITMALLSVWMGPSFGQVGGPAIDPHKGALFDDGSAMGAMRTRPSKWTLVPVPFSELGYKATVTGSSAVTYNHGSGGDLKNNPTAFNSDGSGTTINISVPPQAAGGSGGAVVACWFAGPDLGIRWVRNYLSTNSFSCYVDGMAFEVPQTLIYPDGTVTATGIFDDHDHYFLVCDSLPDLPDGSPHYLEIRFCQKTSGSAEQWQLSGLLLSPLGGYATKPRVGGVLDSAVLTTSYVAVVPSGSELAGIKELNFHNESGANASLFVLQADHVMWEKTLTPGGTDGSMFSISFPGDAGVGFNRSITGAGSLAWKASAGSAIYAQVIGSN